MLHALIAGPMKVTLSQGEPCIQFTISRSWWWLWCDDDDDDDDNDDVDDDDDDDAIEGLFGEAQSGRKETSLVRFGMFLRSLENKLSMMMMMMMMI